MKQDFSDSFPDIENSQSYVLFLLINQIFS